MWREEARKLKLEQGKSWTETANKLKHYFTNKTEKQIIETIRGYIRSLPEYKTNNIKTGEIVGVIGDTHFPFAHSNYIHFLEDTFNKYRVDRIVHVGDLVDHHAISRFQTEVDAFSATTEFELAQKDVSIYTRTFKNVDVLLGNHDLIPQRQCATLGIIPQFLKGFKELWQLPKGWNVHEQLEINNVMYEHGIGFSGSNAALNKAINSMQSCVIGHVHSFGGCLYKSNSKHLIFGLNVGCGIDIDKYAFRYGKYNKNRETLGCGIVFNDSNAIFVPMADKYFRHK